MKRERIKRSSRVLEERRKKTFIKTLWLLFALVVFLIALAFLSRMEDLLIDSVRVSGNEVISSEMLEGVALNTLEENPLFIFAGNNKFLYSKKILISSLKDEFPRILHASVRREGGTLLLSVVERERSYLWCGNDFAVDTLGFTEKECFFVDESGLIFDKAPNFSKGVYFTFYSKVSDTEPIGQHILDFDTVKNIMLLVDALDQEGLPAHSLVVLDDTQYELLLNIGSSPNSPAKLLFSYGQSVDEIFNKLKTIMSEEPFKTEFAEKRNKLEYIDVRFNNRVFYRFR